MSASLTTPSGRVLRKYQGEARDAVRADLGRGITRPAVVLPTGTGKTDVLASLVTPHAVEHGPGSVLALAHRGELLDQMTARFLQHDASVPVGRWQASRRDARRPVTAGSVQSLQNEMSWEAYERANGRPSLIIVDECHHAVSPSYMRLLSWAGAFDHVPTVGFTATMVRGDRIGLGDVWQSVAFQRDIEWAIRQGFLVEPRGKVVVIDSIHLDEVKVDRAKGDYAEGELGSMVEQGVDQIVDSWIKHAGDRLTAAFLPTVESAYALAAEFVGRGIAAEVVVGETKRPKRDAIYRRLAAGETRVLCGVMVTTEGWDCPPVSCILQARPTRLPGLYQQIVGRGLRTSPGKSDCLVLDVVGASRYQKLVSLVDLHPTAEIDTAELDALPCELCRCAPCECPEIVEDEVEDAAGIELPGKPKLIGPAEYEDIELFARSGLTWLFTRGGTRFLPAGDRIAIIWQSPKTGAIRTGHCLSKAQRVGGRWTRDGHWFPDAFGGVDGWDLDTARMAAEAWATLYAPTIASKSASWRKNKSAPPSAAQLRTAAQLGIVDAHTYTRARLSDEISIVFASRALDS